MNRSSILCCSALALAVSACGTTGTTVTTVTNIPTAWTNPDYSGPGFSRIFVIAVGSDDATRRQFEDHMVREFARRGVPAVPSYAHLPNADRHSRDAIREAIASGNYDGVTISRVVGREQVKTYVPGRSYEAAQTPTGGYYTEEVLARNGKLADVEEFHAAVFTEFHRKSNRLTSEGAIQKLFEQFGVGQDDFLNAWNSFEVNQKIRVADDLVRRYNVTGVPAVVINGKFRTGAGPNEAGSVRTLLEVMDELVARETVR